MPSNCYDFLQFRQFWHFFKKQTQNKSKFIKIFNILAEFSTFCTTFKMWQQKSTFVKILKNLAKFSKCCTTFKMWQHKSKLGKRQSQFVFFSKFPNQATFSNCIDIFKNWQTNQNSTMLKILQTNEHLTKCLGWGTKTGVLWML